MEIFKQIGPLQAFLNNKRSEGASIGLVPTMGALHNGHISLIEASRKNGDFTVCSLFVNPKQFNNSQDLAKYPRNLSADEAILRQARCSLLFAPDVTEMYEQARELHFDFGELGHILEGKFRPGHFSGVALVVTKLFNIVKPSNAYFGCKDYQQFRIISLLNEEMKFGIRLYGMPTVREKDGLALSSRNMLLNPEERKRAPILYQTLRQSRKELLQGNSWTNVRTEMVETLNKVPWMRLEYLELANKITLGNTFGHLRDSILLIAAYVGDVRLIDNLAIAE